ncbi:MAG: tRNA pseudouridine(55) synthase TruB [Sinobacteraceae bacterium]|nr:tRNA pseudouridine(55) synthase TruB [Nevskiaceae bacterium]MCP5340439.1 tRNA pseudouridine(55) synthase TruB [Nevskiaceae bacterium]MCP5359914.1 tRNA pseudouridine(55) synthase TruB [Nevskiaceae bacterium]
MSCGLLLLDKPLGLSSNGATQRVRRLLREPKAGHVGSLDPLATGMLPICLGEATKLAGEVLDGDKVYTFRIALGSRTATGDTEGEVIETAAVPPLQADGLRQVLAGFLGESLQVPPMYSALKSEGRPLYELARAGITVERAARRIRIERLELRALGPDWLDCELRCGKGTYVRSLAEDIARALGTCGHVAVLRREAVEPFDAEAMITLPALEAALARGEAPPLLAPDVAVEHLPAVELAADFARRVQMGQAVRVEPAPTPPPMPQAAGQEAGENEWTVRLYAAGKEFMGLGWARADGRIRAKRLFVAPGSPAP